jgi:methylated-DNA-protein-cysteine methyltransferase-like protein
MNFYQQVYKIVNQIPPGRVMNYGQIAALISTPRAARAVGFALRALPADTKIPWHRVINSQGLITIKNLQFPPQLQADLLRKEKINVYLKQGAYCLKLNQYIYFPKSNRY